MSQFSEYYEYSNPLFPLTWYNVFQEEWEYLKKQGAAIVPCRTINDINWFGDGDYTEIIPVIEFNGKQYERFLDLIKDFYGEEEAAKKIEQWEQQLKEEENNMVERIKKQRAKKEENSP